MKNPLIEIAIIIGLLVGLGAMIFYKAKPDEPRLPVREEPVNPNPPVEQVVAFEPLGAKNLPNKGMWRGNPAVADLNRDGFDDIVCAIRNEEGLYVFLGDGKGNWKKSVEGIARTLDYGGADVADFNEDGHLDIVYTTHSTPIRVFLGDGTGESWKELRDDFLSYGKIIGDVATGDFDGDDHVDIVGIDMFSSREGRGILLFFGDGQGGFRLGDPMPLERSKMFGTAVDVGDFDGDGDLDIVASLRNPSAYLNDGKGNFVLHNEGLPTTSTGGSYFNTAVGDLVPGSGGDEIVFAAIMKQDADTQEVFQDGLTAWTLGEDGVWKSVSKGLPEADTFYDAEVADFDNDGFLDIVAGGYSRAATIFLGNGKGEWREVGQIEGTEGARPYLGVGDFNGDDWTDVLTISQYGTGVKVWAREPGNIVRDRRAKRAAAPR